MQDFAEIVCEALKESTGDEALLLLIKIPASSTSSKKDKSPDIYDPFEKFGSTRYGGGAGGGSGSGSSQDAILMDNPSQS